MMIDGIKSFVSGLSTGTPVLSAEAVHELTERIVNPRLPRKDSAGAMDTPRAAWEEEITSPPGTSRARVIFDASEEAKPFNPADFDFEMADEESALEALPPAAQEVHPAAEAQKPAAPPGRILGMTRLQLTIIAALGLAFLCTLAVFAYLIINPTLLLP